MTKLKWVLLLLVSGCIVPFSVVAGDFDGSKPLICAVIDIVECGPGGECQKVSPETVNVPRFVRLNFEEKQIQATQPDGAVRVTTIERIEHVDGKLILQGAEEGVEGVRDGLGWTMAIAEDTGKMVLTASGDEVGFVVFGACTPQ